MPYTNKQKIILDREDVDNMIADSFEVFGEEKGLEVSSLIAFLWKAGSRISEAVEIKRDDVKTDGDFLLISVRQKKDRGAKANPTVLPFKRYEEMEKDYMNRLIIKQAKRIAFGQLVWDFNRTTAWKYVTKLNNKIFPHTFRHTRATILADRGASDSQLRRWFGWSVTSRMPTQYVNQSQLQMRPISRLTDD